MGSASWLTSFSCTVVQSSKGAYPSTISQWLQFIFLSPCPQRALLSSIDLLFLLLVILFAAQKLYSKFTAQERPGSDLNKLLIEKNRARLETTIWFKLSLILSVLFALICIVFCVLAFTTSKQSQWKLTNGLFWLVHAVTHSVIAILIIHEKRFEAARHPLALRVYWAANFVIFCLFTASGIIRLVSAKETGEPNLRFNDIVFIVFLPMSMVLLYIAIDGSTGITMTRTVQDGEEFEPSNESNVTAYASASALSKLFWFWMNPLLKKGYVAPLVTDQVPSLSPEHRAAARLAIFESKWPKLHERIEHPVRTTLIRCFWKDILFTGFLAVIRISVMFMGPALIQSFIDYTSGKRSSPYEGYYLILSLMFAKFFEALTTHHFNFHSQKLGMLIRCTLITSIYKKGLKLSSSARQAHGIGQIVNYMAVDAQQLSDMMLQLHAIWLTPFQVAITFALLYAYLRAAVAAAAVGLLAVFLFVFLTTKNNNRFMMQLMMGRDSRMKATNEMLNNMRVIKFQAWEKHFQKRVLTFRGIEFKWLTKFMYSVSATMLVMGSSPAVISTITFGFAILLGIRLDAGTVFTAMSLFRLVQEPIRTFPQSLISLSQAVISLGRLDRFMMSGELKEDSVEREEVCNNGIAVEVRDGSFSWEDEEGVVLKDLNFNVRKGELTAVVGIVGSGKSSLLASVLGEMHKLSGRVRVCGTTAYVAQTSWIQNGTIEENILFGLPMDRNRYREVIRVCCLEKDLEMMEFGDQTEIGERGINLSGGQKQRIQLARAVYQDCDVYLLDDVFSAVDAHTGSEIFKECVRGILRDKTVILVTHQVDFLHNVDLILVMRDGMIVQSGKYSDLLSSGTDFEALVAAHETSMESVENSSAETVENRPQLRKSSSIDDENNAVDKPSPDKGSSKLIQDEERETGRVGWEVYKVYCTEAFGWWGVAVVLGLAFAGQLSSMSSDYWLSYETSDENAESFDPSLFITVYAILACVSLVLVAFRSFGIILLGLRTATVFFSQILNCILHAPMSFFDTTPSGRILSRASNDQTNIDLFIPIFMESSLVLYFAVFGIIVVICQYSWPTAFFLIPLGWLNVWYRAYFLSSSRELTRLDAITKAPIIHHFSESITGVTTIRSFRKQELFCDENIKRVNANLCMDFYNNGSKEWLGFRLELLGSIFLCISALFMILLPSSIINPATVGLSLSYGLSLNSALFWAIYVSCFIENKMVSVERIKQFSIIPSEAAWRVEHKLPPPNWPTRGDVHLQDLLVRYRPNTPLVLKGITLSIHGGEKIGVVGRTGSGKSTLVQVFFRLVEPSGGKIIVDGIDIGTLGLHDLRSRFGIIPQEPVLFEGTVRSNVDPVGQYTDEEIWQSLERCQLKDVVAAKPDKLDASVVANGDNWSVGQRQLLCLGRVMLKRSQLLFMDEATASVDSQTDAVIQKIIREDFATCTIISIAHRIPTVMDCDRVLVVDAGLAKEFDKPSKLLERPSLFGGLVQEYASRSTDFGTSTN
ncbi:ABC transporter C family member 4, partial [Cucurbita argyrosperma subsp. sororia]